METRLQKATNTSTTRRRRARRYDRVKAATDALDAFKARNALLLEQLQELANEYNAAVQDMEKHLRANPEVVHLGPFKTHFKTKTPPTIDLGVILEKAPELLIQPGVVTRIDLKRAEEVATAAKCIEAVDEAYTPEQSLNVSRPKALRIDWPAA